LESFEQVTGHGHIVICPLLNLNRLAPTATSRSLSATRQLVCSTRARNASRSSRGGLPRCDRKPELSTTLFFAQPGSSARNSSGPLQEHRALRNTVAASRTSVVSPRFWWPSRCWGGQIATAALTNCRT